MTVKVPYSACEKQKNVVRVLHVDDDVCFLDVSKQILMTYNNFEIDTVTSVDDAFKKIAQQTYDALVSDYEMPQKNGLDFLKEIREQNNQIPFILFTGKGREDVAIKALNLGADRYINKQGNPDTVYGELSDALIKTIEHKQSKKMLVESESKYRKLLENSLQGIAIIRGSPPKFVFANAAMEKLFGYTPEEMTALSPEQINKSVHPDDRDAFFNRFKKRLEGKETESTYLFRGFGKDGSLRWVEVCANLIEFNGKPAVQGVFLDITENKKVEESLRESEHRYRELANCLPDIVFETDLNGKLEFANEGAARISGYCINEIEKGLDILQFIVPDDREKAAIKIQRLFSGSNYSPAEYTFLRKDGTTFPALVTATPRICKNKMTGLRGIAIDISGRKEIEKALVESEEKFRNLAEESPNIIFINKRGRVVYANKKSEEITGYSREELYSPKFNFLSLYPPEYGATVKSTYSKHLRGKTVSPYEYVLITRDGKRINAIVNTTLIEYEGDKAILGIVTDITERKKAEKDLQESELKYRNLFNNSNEKYLSIFGLTREEMKGRKSLSFWADPLERQKMVHLIQADGFVKDFECKLLNKQRDIRHCLISVRLCPDQGILEGTIIDLTERKVAEDKLRESQHLTQKMLFCTPNLIYIYDLQENCNIYSNKEVVDFLGYSPEQIKSMGSKLFDNILYPDDVQVVAKHHARFTNAPDNATYDVVYRMKHSSGEWRWLQSRDTLFARTEQGLGKQILGICEDITELKKTDERRKVLERKVNEYSKHLKYCPVKRCQ